MRSFYCRRRGSGFTLIELLVVIAIIAILAAILFPVFANAKRQGQKTSCGSNLKQLSMAVIQYASDNGGGVPPVCVVTSGVLDWSGSNHAYRTRNATYTALRPYTKNDSVYICPGVGLAGLPCDYVQSTDRSTRYHVDYRFNIHMNLFDGGNSRTKALDACRFPKRFYMLSDRHSNHHYENDKGQQSQWVMLMVMADGHLAGSVKPYAGNAWKDRKGTLKYDHWDFPNCHSTDLECAADYY